MAPHKCNQIEEISTLKANQNNMADNIREIKDDLKQIKNLLTSGYFDEKYATKITEKIVYAMAGIILLAFLTSVITSIGLK